MTKLPYEIIINIQIILIKNRELRTYANLCKAFNWDIDTRYFECELLNSRNYKHKMNYDTKMIELWERTGIDDGVPIEYLKKHLNNKTRMFKTMWALSICSGNFCDIIKWYDNHNKYVKYTNNIMADSRCFSKYYKYKEQRSHGACEKCRKKYFKEISKSKMCDTEMQYKYLYVHEDNKYLFQKI